MEDNQKCLEERARDFLVSISAGIEKFSNALNNADSDIQGFLLKRGYVEEGNITALGRTYTAHYSN